MNKFLSIALASALSCSVVSAKEISIGAVMPMSLWDFFVGLDLICYIFQEAQLFYQYLYLLRPYESANANRIFGYILAQTV